MPSTGISSWRLGYPYMRCCMEYPAYDRPAGAHRFASVLLRSLGRPRLGSGMLGAQYTNQLCLGELGLQPQLEPLPRDRGRAGRFEPCRNAVVLAGMVSI